MTRLPFLLVGLLAVTTPATGQPARPAAEVPAPKGWGKETIELPPAFAPNMTWKGTEQLRFAPGMFKADADDFLSYAMLFALPADQKTDARALERELLTYYRGLCEAVLKGKGGKADAAAFTLTLKEVKADPAPKRPGGEAFSAYEGDLRWVEPFVTGKPQTLRLEVRTWSCEKSGHRLVFVAASPRPPEAAVWKELRAIGDGVRCHPEAPPEEGAK
jgi:hypothetical protein